MLMYTNFNKNKRESEESSMAVHTHTHTHTQLNLTNRLRFCRRAYTVGASVARQREAERKSLTTYTRVANNATLFLRAILCCNRVRDG